MDIFNSDWLIHMLQKTGKTPVERLLVLFDVLDDWSNAPGVQAYMRDGFKSMGVVSKLQTYLSQQAALTSASHPEALSAQIYWMAIAACQEKWQNKDSECFTHAKVAAQALIAAQTKKEINITSKAAVYGLVASVAVMAVTLSLLFSEIGKPNVILPSPVVMVSQPENMLAVSELQATPAQTAALFARIDYMRRGNCQLIEGLLLPESQKKIYYDNVVNGQLSTDRHEQELVYQLLEKVRCNYTPMLMANSTG